MVCDVGGVPGELGSTDKHGTQVHSVPRSLPVNIPWAGGEGGPVTPVVSQMITFLPPLSVTRTGSVLLLKCPASDPGSVVH